MSFEKTLYKRQKDGSIREWAVRVDGDQITVTHGQTSGAMQSKVTHAKGKNKGRANETSNEQQAQLEAQSKWNEQLERNGYRLFEDIDAPSLYLEPMLALDATKVIHRVDFNRAVAQPKLNGCFSYATKIWTDKGLLPIGMIVEEGLDVLVASHNDETCEVEFKPIANRFDNGLKPQEEWSGYHDKHRVTLTHKVYTAEGYIPAQETLGMQTLHAWSGLGSVITGMLLGDACAAVEKRHRGSVSWRLKWSTCAADRLYGEYKKQLLQPALEISDKEFTSGYGFQQVSFCTSAATRLPYDLSRFYNTDPGSDLYGTRKSNLSFYDIAEDFTDLSLAIWYFDDASLTYNNGNKRTPKIQWSLARYSDSTVEAIKKLFKQKYGCHPTIKKYGRDVKMSFSSPESFYLLGRIAKEAGKLLPRKIPDEFHLELPMQPRETSWQPSIVKPKTRNQGSKELRAYDIEVEDNHNYFADGMLVHNCRVLWRPDLQKLQSRKGTFYEAPEHIIDQLRGTETPIDGELYIHGEPLNELVGAARKANALTERLEFHAFDIADANTPYLRRDESLKSLLQTKLAGKPHLKYVGWHALVKAELDAMHNNWVEQGYEGLMIRHIDGLYLAGRSPDLFKYKKFVDSEFRVVGVKEDKDGGAVLTMITEHGSEFSARPRGTLSYRRKLLDGDCVGKMATVRYFEITNVNGVPQFPSVVAIGDEK